MTRRTNNTAKLTVLATLVTLVSVFSTANAGFGLFGQAPGPNKPSNYVKPGYGPEMNIVVCPRQISYQGYVESLRVQDHRNSLRAWSIHLNRLQSQLGFSTVRTHAFLKQEIQKASYAVWYFRQKLQMIARYRNLKSTRIILRGRFANHAAFGRVLRELESGVRPSGVTVVIGP